MLAGRPRDGGSPHSRASGSPHGAQGTPSLPRARLRGSVQHFPKRPRKGEAERRAWRASSELPMGLGPGVRGLLTPSILPAHASCPSAARRAPVTCHMCLSDLGLQKLPARLSRAQTTAEAAASAKALGSRCRAKHPCLPQAHIAEACCQRGIGFEHTLPQNTGLAPAPDGQQAPSPPPRGSSGAPRFQGSWLIFTADHLGCLLFLSPPLCCKLTQGEPLKARTPTLDPRKSRTAGPGEHCLPSTSHCGPRCPVSLPGLLSDKTLLSLSSKFPDSCC